VSEERARIETVAAIGAAILSQEHGAVSEERARIETVAAIWAAFLSQEQSAVPEERVADTGNGRLGADAVAGLGKSMRVCASSFELTARPHERRERKEKRGGLCVRGGRRLQEEKGREAAFAAVYSRLALLAGDSFWIPKIRTQQAATIE
jgi:hypothetical protein